MKELKIMIYPDGYVQTETKGIKGKECEKYYSLFERLLQNRTVEETYTEEYYEECQEEINEVEEEWVIE